MATIKPFLALRPQEVYIDKLLSLKPSADAGKSSGFMAQLLDNGHHGNETLTNAHIIKNLMKMISKGDFYQEEHPCIFIYEITEGDSIQTGVWAVTDLSDFDNGHIKTHIATQDCNASGLKNYRDEVGLEGGPVLITHRPNRAIKLLLQQIKQAEANSVYYTNRVFHRIWTVYDLKTIRQLSLCFSELQNVYLADGHHRLVAAVSYRNAKRHTHQHDDFNYISSFYLASDQLKIKESHWVIIPPEELDMDQFFRNLKKSFSITKSQRNELVIPLNKRDFGLYIDGKWYNMSYKLSDNVQLPDACLLQEKVFIPLLKIKNQFTAQQIKAIGGDDALYELERVLLAHPTAIAITQSAINAEQLIDLAHQGVVMPAKSTWVEPKIPFGLLLRKLKEPVFAPSC